MTRKAFLALGAAAALFSLLVPCASLAQSVSVAGNAAIGGQLSVTNTTNSTSPTTGAATIAGGLGVGGNLNVGGTISGTISPPTENPNTVYAGPSSGSPAAASFRPLAQADLPNVTPSGGNTASPVPTILGRVVTPIDFGAVGNGTTNDTTAVQNAIDAAEASGGGGILYLGQYQYCINQINITGTIKIIGTGTNGQSIPTTGFRACSANLAPMINITGNGAVLENFGINMQTPSGAFSNSGETLFVQGFSNQVNHVSIIDPCIGIIEAGADNGYSHIVIASFNNNLNLSACGGIQIGTSTIQSIDVHISHSDIPLESANTNESQAYGWGMNFVNAGGPYIANNDILFMQTGTIIDPPNGANFNGGQFSNTVLGDSTAGSSLIIQPGSGGIVIGFYCDGCWSGTAGNWKGAGTYYSATGVWVHNDNGGTVSGVRFINLKQEYSATTGLAIGPNVIGTQIIGSEFCGDSIISHGTYEAILTSGNNTVISGNYIAANCFAAQPGTSLDYGIHLLSGANYVVQGNWIGADNTGTKSISTGILITSAV